MSSRSPLSTRACQPAWLLLLLPVLACAQAAGDRAINPLTGMPLSLEQMHWSLEQARLEEQLQASLLNRRKFELERQRLDLGPSAGGPPGGMGTVPAGSATPDVSLPDGLRSAQLPGWPGSGITRPDAGALDTGAAVGAARAALASMVTGPVPSKAASVASRRNSRPAATNGAVLPGWTVLGVRARGSEWCLLVEEGAGLRTACPGEVRAGHRIDAVGAQDYRIDGVSHSLDIPVARLRPPVRAPAADDEGADGVVTAADPVALPEGAGSAQGLQMASGNTGVGGPSGAVVPSSAALRPSAAVPLLQR